MPTSTDTPALRAFAARVRELRTARGLSQGEFAELSGMHRTYISAVERGRRNVALLNVLRLAKALDTDPAALVDGLELSEDELSAKR